MPACQRLPWPAVRWARQVVGRPWASVRSTEPTNNLAEQAIRFVVIDRLITQGTRSEAGQRWCERIWTVMATCSQQGRSVWEYLSEAVKALWAGEKAPSLAPVG